MKKERRRIRETGLFNTLYKLQVWERNCFEEWVTVAVTSDKEYANAWAGQVPGLGGAIKNMRTKQEQQYYETFIDMIEWMRRHPEYDDLQVDEAFLIYQNDRAREGRPLKEE